MLNYTKVLEECRRVTPTVLQTTQHEGAAARLLWQKLAPEMVPDKQMHWKGAANTASTLQAYQEPYTVIAVDGSQIYPDRHAGSSWYVINLGSIVLNYGSQISSVVTDSQPTLHTALNDQPALINARRNVQELAYGYELASAKSGVPAVNTPKVETPKVLLVDGPLLFWDAELVDPLTGTLVLDAYLAQLQRCYEGKILLAGYTSMPRSRDLITLLLRQEDARQQAATYDQITDADIVTSFLPAHACSTLFTNAVNNYPAALQIRFLYMYTGHEVVRIEVPAYVAADEQAMAKLLAIIMDQVAKGLGYPVCLAEAHEQAVIREADRVAFYHMVQEQHRSLGTVSSSFQPSRKSLSKRSPAV